MHDVARMPRVIFGHDDLSGREKPACHLDGRFQISPRIPTQVEYEFGSTRLDELTQCIAEQIRRIRSECRELDDENAIWPMRRRHDGDVDDVANHFDLARTTRAFS